MPPPETVVFDIDEQVEHGVRRQPGTEIDRRSLYEELARGHRSLSAPQRRYHRSHRHAPRTAFGRPQLAVNGCCELLSVAFPGRPTEI